MLGMSTNHKSNLRVGRAIRWQHAPEVASHVHCLSPGSEALSQEAAALTYGGIVMTPVSRALMLEAYLGVIRHWRQVSSAR